MAELKKKEECYRVFKKTDVIKLNAVLVFESEQQKFR